MFYRVRSSHVSSNEELFYRDENKAILVSVALYSRTTLLRAARTRLCLRFTRIAASRPRPGPGKYGCRKCRRKPPAEFSRRYAGVRISQTGRARDLSHAASSILPSSYLETVFAPGY